MLLHHTALSSSTVSALSEDAGSPQRYSLMPNSKADLKAKKPNFLAEKSEAIHYKFCPNNWTTSVVY